MDNVKKNKRIIVNAATRVTILLATITILSVTTTDNVFALDKKDSIKDSTTCDECFDKLNASQQAAFNKFISID